MSRRFDGKEDGGGDMRPSVQVSRWSIICDNYAFLIVVSCSPLPRSVLTGTRSSYAACCRTCRRGERSRCHVRSDK
jgi:hypothetical protein